MFPVREVPFSEYEQFRLVDVPIDSIQNIQQNAQSPFWWLSRDCIGPYQSKLLKFDIAHQRTKRAELNCYLTFKIALRANCWVNLKNKSWQQKLQPNFHLILDWNGSKQAFNQWIWCLGYERRGINQPNWLHLYCRWWWELKRHCSNKRKRC